jgi:hypothetical protein
LNRTSRSDVIAASVCGIVSCAGEAGYDAFSFTINAAGSVPAEQNKAAPKHQEQSFLTYQSLRLRYMNKLANGWFRDNRNLV